jgi:LacI family transcriptional regulator
MGVTINDVARHAGVSHTTVSWVIHDDPRITPATKAKVWAAIRELDYHPNPHARNLVRGKTNTVALVATVWSTSFETRFLKGLENSFPGQKSGYDINLYSLMGDAGSKTTVLKDILHGNRADAVILVNLTADQEVIQAYRKKSVPLVLVEEEAHGAHVLKMDNRRGAADATAHLIHSGRRHIALTIGDPEDPHSGMSARERLAGFTEAMRGAGLAVTESAVTRVSEYYFETGERLYRETKARMPFLDAVFCAAGDTIALGMMKAAIEDGVRVPEDLAIIGYDNIDVCAMVDPPLSSVEQPIEQLGRDAFARALDALDSDPEPEVRIYPPKLIIRSSC